MTFASTSSSYSRRSKIIPAGLAIGGGDPVDRKPILDIKPIVETGPSTSAPADDIEEDDEEPEPEPEPEHSSLADMLKGGGGDEDYYGYDEEY